MIWDLNVVVFFAEIKDGGGVCLACIMRAFGASSGFVDWLIYHDWLGMIMEWKKRLLKIDFFKKLFI